MDIKVSVIIPTYNAANTVIYAIESALHQTMSDLEVIVVDDCSTDATLSALTERFGDNDKVRIVSQPENGGVSMARNRGIEEARGEYLVFLDSDDAMRADMLEKMLAAAQAHDADVLHTTGCLLPTVQPVPDDISGLPLEDYKPLIPELCEKGDAVYFAPQDKAERLAQWYTHKYHWSVWNKLFRRSLIEEHHIRFDKLRMAEDMIFCFKAFFLADTYAVLPGQWYVYRVGVNSLSRQKSTIEMVVKLTENQIKAAQAVTKFLSATDYFRDHPVDCVKVQRAVCDSIDRFYLVPALGQVTLHTAQESGAVSALFDSEYGEKGAFVEYLYWRLHELMKEGLNVADLGANAEKFSSKTEEMKKKAQGGEKA